MSFRCPYCKKFCSVVVSPDFLTDAEGDDKSVLIKITGTLHLVTECCGVSIAEAEIEEEKEITPKWSEV